MPVEKKTPEMAGSKKRVTARSSTKSNRTVEPEFDLPEDAGGEQAAAEPVIQPEETFRFKATHFYAVLVVFAFALGIIIGYLAWGRTPPTIVMQQPEVAAAAPTSAPQYVRYKIPTDGFPSLGPADAPITLVEFADFQCPYCRQWEQQTYRPLLEAYPGKIRIVYRDFPLTAIHPNAMPAAEAAQCANEQGKFWEYHDKLFGSESLGDDVYKQYAQDLGLDLARFTDCMTNHKYAEKIQADSSFATNLGINSTPTFFINGLAIIGAQPLNAFTSVIDKELAGEIPQ